MSNLVIPRSSSHIFLEKAISSNKIIILWFKAGMRGNAIYRILSAHPEVFWDAKSQKFSNELIEHPLDLPNSVASFDIPALKSRWFGVAKFRWAYSTYHTHAIFLDIYNKELPLVVSEWIATKAYKHKKLFLICHPSELHNLYKDSIYNTKPHIWLYGTMNRFNKPIKYYAPSTNLLAYNLNIDALFSTDYLTFETEYFKLIAHFNLTSCLNRVRAFILLALEREQYISKFY